MNSKATRGALWKPHQGILINKIGFGGIPGAIFALGVMTLFLVAFPNLLWFLVAAVGLGVLGSGLLMLYTKHF